MLNKPRIKQFLTVFPLDERTWALQGGDGELWRIQMDEQRYRVFAQLLPYLNGAYERRDILRRLADCDVPQGAVEQMLSQLERSSLLEEAETTLLTAAEQEQFGDQLRFFSRFSAHRSAPEFQKQLRETRVDLFFESELSRALLRQLGGSGIGEIRLLGRDGAALRREVDYQAALRNGTFSPALSALEIDARSFYPEHSRPADLLLLPLSGWDPALVEAANDAANRSGTPWLLLQGHSIREGVVGPLFVPGQTACYMCLESRLLSNMTFHVEYSQLRDYLKQRGEPGAPCGSLRPFNEILAGLATLEIVKYLTGFAAASLAGAFLSINWFTLKLERHEVLRLPRCPYCRAPQTTEPFPWKEAPIEIDA